MDYFEFIALAESEKLKAIEGLGVLVAEQTKGRYRYELFQLGSFYVEQKINIYWKQKKRYSRSFISVSDLDDYLNRIDISDLLLAGNDEE